MKYTQTGPLTTTGATTTLAMPALTVPGNTLFQAQSVTLVISNPSGSGQTITSGSLIFSDTVGGVVSTVTYVLAAVSIAAGASQVFYVALSAGLLTTPTLSVTFGGTPSAGTLSVEAFFNPNA